MEYNFKKDNPSVEKRREESDKIKMKYIDRVPIICEKDAKSKLENIDKTKYLVPKELTVSQFSFIIRKRLSLDKSTAIFLLVNGKYSISGDSLIRDVYDKHADPEDGFLYISYTGEDYTGN